MPRDAQPTSASTQLNRRSFERIAVPPMYTGLQIRRLEDEVFSLQGHAYDISEGGVQFEADIPLDPGTEIGLMIDLPGCRPGDPGPGRAVFAIGRVIWANEDEIEFGPARMAAAFTQFCREGDKQRLMHAVAGHGRTGRVAA
ncbi:MAG: PilZ domain-containing protein [Planctomycetota bacterium]